MIGRRKFVTLLGSVTAAWPLVASAQQGERRRRIGVLLGSSSETEPFALAELKAFRQGLRDLGWSEERNLQIDLRGSAGDPARTQASAAELVGLAPDLIVANTLPAVIAIARLTSTLPIVQVAGADPVASGLVASLAKPGGNITGFSAQEPATSGKWLEVLKEVAPRLTRALILQNSDNPNRNLYFPFIQEAARAHGMQVALPDVSNGDEVAAVLGDFAKVPDGGLIVLPGPFTTSNRALIIALAARHRLPAAYPSRSFVDDGGLVSFGNDFVDMFQRSATYVDRILRGARPSDLPIQLPSKFELVINLKTAKALGLEVPPLLLARADEVIE
jgi:putative ABC transport system substrate-binding protein